MLRDNVAARALAGHFGPATVIAAAGNVVELSYSLSEVMASQLSVTSRRRSRTVVSG